MVEKTIQEYTMQELEYQSTLCNVFLNLASVGVDTQKLVNEWTELKRQVDNEILERMLLDADGTPRT